MISSAKFEELWVRVRWAILGAVVTATILMTLRSHYSNAQKLVVLRM